MKRLCLGALTALGLGLMLLAGCGGGAGGSSLHFLPGQPTPTRIVTSDGLITALVPADALAAETQLKLENRSGGDAEVPGPEGRTLLMAVGFTGTAAGAGTGTTPPAAPTLDGSVDLTMRLPVTLRSDAKLDVYLYNPASARYEKASLSAAVSVTGTETYSNVVTFSITQFGRYAVYNLLPEEIPPAVPQGLKLLGASTQVRKLGWQAVSGALIAGYNLYRADPTQASVNFTKVNSSALLTATTYSDETSSAGAFRYRVTAVNTAGLESDPSAEVDSPAVAFDVAFTFGEDRLDTPLALALDATRDRLVIADAGLKHLEVYALDGTHLLYLEHYPGGDPLNAAGLAYNADGSALYVSDAAAAECRILDPDWLQTGIFGTRGKGPGEFEAPGAVLVAGSQILVADTSNSNIQVFTPLGVYLRTIATQGTTDGAFDSPTALLMGDGAKIYASDTNNNRVQIFKGADLTFDSILDYTPEDGGPLDHPDGLVLDFRGRLYVSDTGNHRVVVFDSSGKFLFHFGADGALTVEFSDVTGPRGLALDRTTGYLYVCDPGNHRIVVFKT